MDDLVNQLRNAPLGSIMTATPSLYLVPIPRASLPFYFAPVKEPANSPEPVFLSRDPETVYRSGNFTSLPIIIGSTSVSR
jgi:hypothetical protein